MTSIASVPKSIHLYTALKEHLGQRMFETTFKNLDDTLRKDDGCSTEMDYIIIFFQKTLSGDVV